MKTKLIVAFYVSMMLFSLTLSIASADTLQYRGSIQNIANGQSNTKDLVWNASNFAGLYYDLDSNIATETLTIKANELTAPYDRTLSKNSLIYETYPVQVEYEVHRKEGITVDGNSKYYAEGWMAEKYVAINGKANKIAKLLLEMKSNEKEDLAINEELKLPEGFTLTSNKTDLDNKEVLLSLSKDEKEIDSKLVKEGEVYVYAKDLADEKEVPIFSIYVDKVFRGNESKVVQLKYAWLMSEEVIEIDNGKIFNAMEVKNATKSGIELANEEPIDLEPNSIVDIMGNLKFKVADTKEVIRFYPMLEYIESGTYEIRGTVQNIENGNSNANDLVWKAYNFAGLYYDLDSDLATPETLSINANELTATSDRTISKNGIIYKTKPISKEYEFTKEGLYFMHNGNKVTEYPLIGWQAEKYVALEDDAQKLSRLIYEQDATETKTLIVGEPWDLGEGYTLTAKQVDLDGRKVWLSLAKDGVEVESEVVIDGNFMVEDKDMAGKTDVVYFVTYVDAVFRGTEANMAQLKYTWLISDKVEEIKEGDIYGAMEVINASSSYILLQNNKSLNLDQGTTVDIMGNLKFKVADDSSAIRFYPLVEKKVVGIPVFKPEYDKLEISPSYYSFRLKPSENQTITVTVKNPYNKKVHTQIQFVEDQYRENVIDKNWIKVTPNSADIQAYGKQEYTIKVSVPEDAEVGYYNAMIAFTNDTFPTPYPVPYPKYVNVFSLGLEVWVPPSIKILSPRYIYDKVESGQNYTYNIELENIGNSSISLKPEISLSYIYYSNEIPEEWITIDSPPQINAKSKATVKVTLNIPRNASAGSYSTEINLNISDRGLSEWDQKVQMNLEVWTPPTEPFLKTFEVPSEGKNIKITLSANQYKYSIYSASTVPTFKVTLTSPDNKTLEPEANNLILSGSVNIVVDNNIPLPPPPPPPRTLTAHTGLVAIEVGYPPQTASTGIYKEYYNKYTETYSISNAKSGTWKLQIMPKDTDRFDYIIEIEG
ncbi:MAG: S-layer protein domain-containing protein [Methanosarcinales archaeon]